MSQSKPSLNNSSEAWDGVLKYLKENPQKKPERLDIAQLVMQDMAARRNFGIVKYGKPVTPFNGRHALKDAYEEVLDLAVYLKQKLVEEGHNGTHVPGDVSRPLEVG